MYNTMQVVLRNRQDCCQERLMYFKVSFLNVDRAKDWPSFLIGDIQNVYTITCRW
jgi:hypothetical protein